MADVGDTAVLELPQEIVEQLVALAAAHYDGDVARTVSALLSGQVRVATHIEAEPASTLAARQKEALRAQRVAAKSGGRKKGARKKSTAKRSSSKRTTGKRTGAMNNANQQAQHPPRPDSPPSAAHTAAPSQANAAPPTPNANDKPANGTSATANSSTSAPSNETSSPRSKPSRSADSHAPPASHSATSRRSGVARGPRTLGTGKLCSPLQVRRSNRVSPSPGPHSLSSLRISGQERNAHETPQAVRAAQPSSSETHAHVSSSPATLAQRVRPMPIGSRRD